MILNKRLSICISLFTLLAAGVFAQYQPIDDEAANAFSVSMQAYLYGTMMCAFGQNPPGAELEQTDSEVSIIFDELNLAALGVEDEDGYTAISGKVTTSETDGGSNMTADLTLSGGPIKSLHWSVENYDMTSEAGDEVEFIIVADGKRFRMSTGDFE